MLRFIARKAVVKTGTYNKYGFVITLHQFCCCPRCKSALNAGPSYQPRYCDQCGQRIDFSDVEWKEEKSFGYAERSEDL